MQLNNIIINCRSAPIENTLLVSAVSLFPLLFLTLRGWTNTFAVFLFIIALVHFFRLPKSSWQIRNISGTEWAVILALSAGFLAILISQLLRQDIKAKPYDGPLRLLLCAPVFLLLLRKKFDFVQVFQFICPLSLLILLAYVHLYPLPVNTIWGGGRFGTYFVDPNTIGAYTMLLGFLCLFSIDAVGRDGMALRLFKYAGALAGIYLEIKSQTRGAWIAEPAMLALWSAIHWQTKSNKELFIAALFSILAIIGLYCFIDVFQSRVNSIYNEISSWLNNTNFDSSAGVRLSMWKISWALFKHSPLYGYGDSGYQSLLVMPQIQSEFSRLTISVMAEVGPHNEYLANMVRSGIFGLLAVLMEFCVPAVIFIKGFKSSAQSVKSASAMGLCLVLGMMITALSMEVLTLKYTISFYGLMIASLCATVMWERTAAIIHDPVNEA